MLIGDPKNPRWVTVTSEPATIPIETSLWRSSAGQLLMAEIIAFWPTRTEFSAFSSLMTVVAEFSTVLSVSYGRSVFQSARRYIRSPIYSYTLRLWFMSIGGCINCMFLQASRCLVYITLQLRCRGRYSPSRLRGALLGSVNPRWSIATVLPASKPARAHSMAIIGGMPC